MCKKIIQWCRIIHGAEKVTGSKKVMHPIPGEEQGYDNRGRDT